MWTAAAAPNANSAANTAKPQAAETFCVPCQIPQRQPMAIRMHTAMTDPRVGVSTGLTVTGPGNRARICSTRRFSIGCLPGAPTLREAPRGVQWSADAVSAVDQDAGDAVQR